MPEEKQETTEKYWQTKRKEFINKLIEDTKKNKRFPWDDRHIPLACQKSARLTEINRKRTEKATENEPAKLIDAAYNGANQFRLSVIGGIRGYKDNRWATINQINELGGHIKKGEHGVSVEHWQEIRPSRKNMTEEEKEQEAKEKEMEAQGWLSLKQPRLSCKTFTVFNLEQTEGLPKEILEAKEHERVLAPEERKLAMENMIKNSEAPITHDRKSENCYDPAQDKIHAMPPELFTTTEAYYGTIAHEIGHSTGHKTRLDRAGITQPTKFGSPRYAREELIAELTSVFLTQAYGVSNPNEEQNHEAYLQSWDRKLKFIEENKEEFFKVVKEADAAATYIRDRMIEKDLTKEEIEKIRGYSPEETEKFKKEDREKQQAAYKEKKAARAKAARKRDRGISR